MKNNLTHQKFNSAIFLNEYQILRSVCLRNLLRKVKKIVKWPRNFLKEHTGTKKSDSKKSIYSKAS
jgi:hypothetical protein